jgi:hypothetical protein
MATVSWPAGLPAYVLAEGYQEHAPDTLLRTPMDAGPAKARRKSTAQVWTITCQVRLTHDQRAVLDQFFVVDTASGALRFDWVHPVTRDACEMRFTERPVYQARGPVHLVASLALEILP